MQIVVMSSLNSVGVQFCPVDVYFFILSYHFAALLLGVTHILL